jgi:hypothetical protein
MMPRLDHLPTGTCIEIRNIGEWKGYASAMGYHPDTQPSERPGFFRMRRDIGVVASVSCPPNFTYEVVN